MKAKELRQKTKKELENLLAENRAKLQRLKFDLAAKKLKNSSQIKLLKKDIARILTVIRNFTL